MIEAKTEKRYKVIYWKIYISRMHHFCMWTVAKIFKSTSRRVLAFLFSVTLISLLLKWGLVCTNTKSRLHVKYVCSNYANGQFLGNLCLELCQPWETPLSCHNYYLEKEAVFSGTWMNTSVVFKVVKRTSLENNILHSLDADNHKIYPSEKEFLNMIKVNVKMKFNVSISDIDAKGMLYIQHGHDGGNRHTEMDNVWTLLRDNEYLALSLYGKFDIFPKLMGTCGSLYAVQKLESISGFWHLMTIYDSQEEWEKRIKISIMILDYLIQLESGLPEPLHICDVKMIHFGVTHDFKKVMYLDLNSVHPLTIANRITGDGSNCKQHTDCDFLDCRSFCNLLTLKCEHGVINNNLQMVCERIFLGWVMSGRVMVPGLLLGPHTPRVLIELLERCANPASETDVPRAPATKDIRQRLYNLLVHLI